MGIFNFGRITNWISLKNLTAPALNNEFNNLFTNLAADTISGAAGDPATLSGMQEMEDPGTEGSENLPVTIQDDIRELRYMTREIVGDTQWYSQVPISLVQISNQLNSLVANQPTRIVSGVISAVQDDTPGQPMFLLPTAAASNGVELKTFPARLEYYVENTLYTQSSDLDIDSLSTAPASQNTCLVNDATLAGAAATLTQGENGTIIQIDTIGTNISDLNGSYAAFKVGSELFIGQVVTGSATPANAGLGTAFLDGVELASHGLRDGDQVIFSSASGVGNPIVDGTTYYAQIIDEDNFYVSLTPGGQIVAVGAEGETGWDASVAFPGRNRLQNCFRGYFFDDTGTWLPREAISNNNTITLLRLTWVFLVNVTTTPALSVTYSQPVISEQEPISPAIGDFWLAPLTGVWSQYNGASWEPVDGILLGTCCQDTSNTVGARALDFNKPYQNLNTFEVFFQNTQLVRSLLNPKISVYGVGYDFVGSAPGFDTAEIVGGVQNSTRYYAYVTNQGALAINDIAPYDRRQDLLGYYLPYGPYRCVAQFDTDSSGDVVLSSVEFAQYHQASLPAGAVTNVAMGLGAVGTENVQDGAITPKKLSAIPLIRAASSGNYTTTSNSLVTVTNQELVGIPVIGGRGVEIFLDNGSNSTGYIDFTRAAAAFEGNVAFLVGVSVYRTWNLTVGAGGASSVNLRHAPSSFRAFYIPTADELATFTLQVSVASGTMAVQNVSLGVRQL